MHSSLNCELHAMMGARPFCTILRKWLKWKQLNNINNKKRSSIDFFFFFNIPNMLVEHGTTHTQGPFWEQWLCCHRVSEVSDRIVHAEHLQPVRSEHLQVWSHTHTKKHTFDRFNNFGKPSKVLTQWIAKHLQRSPLLKGTRQFGDIGKIFFLGTMEMPRFVRNNPQWKPLQGPVHCNDIASAETLKEWATLIPFNSSPCCK